ncbi:MAG: TIGR03032 family protein [Pseudomonadota bacterium]
MKHDPPPRLRLVTSPDFASWLAGMQSSLVVTTGSAGRLLMIGTDDDQNLQVCDRIVPDCSAMAVTDRSFWVNSLFQIWRFANFLDPGMQDGNHDGYFVPVAGHTTGDLDLHDMCVTHDGDPIFVATAFNCVAVKSDNGSFRPLWHPEFIDGLIGEDRCHLTGLACDDGLPAFVTCAAYSNEWDGWRTQIKNGGLVIDIGTDDVIADGLSMPFAPRVFHGELLLLQAGTGELGLIEMTTGKFEPIAWFPGYPRALGFIGMHAIVGTSMSVERGVKEATLLGERLEAADMPARCGLFVVNLLTGRTDHWLEIEGIVEDIASVAPLPEVLNPMAIGFRSEEIRYTVRPEYF